MAADEQTSKSERRLPAIIGPDQGRRYQMGRIRAVFKADGKETAGQYSVSEWWLEPRTLGPSSHEHEDDHVYYVIAGTLSVRLDDADWSQAPQGSYILIPGGTLHAFENQGLVPAGFISFNSPGGFEDKMHSISSWLAAEDLRML
jgi:quercetin dioxygenase-like cupin family protein